MNEAKQILFVQRFLFLVPRPRRLGGTAKRILLRDYCVDAKLVDSSWINLQLSYILVLYSCCCVAT